MIQKLISEQEYCLEGRAEREVTSVGFQLQRELQQIFQIAHSQFPSVVFVEVKGRWSK